MPGLRYRPPMDVFVGRQRELEVLDRSVKPGRLISVTGPSGVGKTTLVRAWAATRDDVRFIECRERDPVEVANELASRHDSSRLNASDAWILAAERLADDGAQVLVLDDISTAFGDLELLRAGWSGCVVTTGHHVVDGDAVASVPVRPLLVPDRTDLPKSDVYELFVETARTVDLSFELDDGRSLDALLRLAEHFEGYPLGLAIAARQAAVLTAPEVVRLVERGVPLTDPTRNGRHRSLDAAIGLSFRRLSRQGQARLFGMSLFRRSVRPETLARLIPEPVEVTLEGVRELMLAGMISRSPYPTPLERFGRFASIAFPAVEPEWARDIEGNIVEEAGRLAGEMFTTDPTQEALEYGEAPSLWRWVFESPRVFDLEDAELGELLTVYARWLELADAGDAETLQRFDALLDRTTLLEAWLAVATLHREPADRQRICESALDLVNTPQDEVRVRTRLAGAFAGQMDLYRAGLELRKAADRGELTTQAKIMRVQAEVPGAGDELEEWLDDALDSLKEELRRLPGTSRAAVRLHIMGMGLKRADESAWAEALDHALQCVREHGNPRWIAYAQLSAADVRIGRGFDLERAIEQLEQATAYFDTIRDPGRAVHARMVRMHGLISLGRAADAIDALDELAEARGTGTRAEELLQASELAARIIAGEVERVRAIVGQLGEPDRADHPIVNRVRAVADAVLAVADRRERNRSWSIPYPDSPPLDAALDVLARVASVRDEAITSAAIEVYEEVETSSVLECRGVAEATAHWWMRRNAGGGLRRLLDLRDERSECVVARDAEAFRVAGRWVSLVDNPMAQRLVQTLIAADGPLDFDELGEVLYPDETLTFDSLQNRVNVAVSRLRKAGLRPFIDKRPAGFVLDRVVVET